MMNRYLWIVLLVPALVFAGCGKPPEMEMNQANEAMQAASSMQSDVYAPTEHSAAQEAMTKAQTELEAQNAKFVLFRSYGQAKTLYGTAVEAANHAKEAAIVGKEAAKQEATALSAEAKTAVADAAKALKSAPRGKDTRADIEAMNAELTSLQSMLTEIDNAMTGEDYMNAKNKSQSVKESAMKMQSEIEAARAKMAGRRKK